MNVIVLTVLSCMSAAFTMHRLFACSLPPTADTGLRPSSATAAPVGTVRRQPPPGVRVSVVGGNASDERLACTLDHLKVPVATEAIGAVSGAGEEAELMRRLLAKLAAEARLARVRGSVSGATTPKVELPALPAQRDHTDTLGADNRDGALAWLATLWRGGTGTPPGGDNGTDTANANAVPSPPATPPQHSPLYAMPTPVALPALGKDVAGELLSRRAAYTAPGREWRKVRRQVAGANPTGDPDIQLLFDGEPADGTDGVTLTPPNVVVEPSNTDVAGPRADHEAAALLAIVVPTAPRIVASSRATRPEAAHYFHFGIECQSAPVYAHVSPSPSPPPTSPPAAANTKFGAWLATLVARCDGDVACAGFSPDGVLYSAVDAVGCSAAGKTAPGVPSGVPPTKGVYTKAPLGSMPGIRYRDVPTPGALPLVSLTPGQAREWAAAGVSPSDVPANHTRVWEVPTADVWQNDLGQVGALPPGAKTEREKVAAMTAVCAATPRCQGFHYPSGWMKASVDATQLQFSKRLPGIFFSRHPVPPLDYVAATVTSLMRAIGGSTDTNSEPDELTCGAPPDTDTDNDNSDEDRDGVLGPNVASAAASAPWRRAGSAATVNGTGGVRLLATAAAAGRTHLYVVDTSAAGAHAFPSGGSDAQPSNAGTDQAGSHYWFTAFAYLRRKYGHLPCVTFLSAGAYTRLTEAREPARGRGLPSWHPDNRGKPMKRGLVSQTLDFVSALRHAAGFSPASHLLVWEDDCHACTGVLSLLGHTMQALDTFDPRWGALKVGNGGSGLLVHRDLVAGLLAYLTTRRGSENVDVSLWRYVFNGGYSDYISKLSWAAHRGLQSSFKLEAAQTWNRVHCTNKLDRHWGWYAPCQLAAAAAASVNGTGGGTGFGANATVAAAAVDAFLGQVAPPHPLAPHADDDLPQIYRYAALARDWDCSVYSPATDGVMPVRKKP